MNRTMMRLGRTLGLTLGLALGLTTAACGGSSTARIKPTAGRMVKLDPVNPKAKREFEAGLRALKSRKIEF